MGAQVTELLLRALALVPFDPALDRGARFGEIAEVVLPYAFFLETAEEALDHALEYRK